MRPAEKGAVDLRYDAVLFDVDGTLVHSSPGILETMRHTFRQMGVDPETLDLSDGRTARKVILIFEAQKNLLAEFFS